MGDYCLSLIMDINNKQWSPVTFPNGGKILDFCSELTQLVT